VSGDLDVACTGLQHYTSYISLVAYNITIIIIGSDPSVSELSIYTYCQQLTQITLKRNKLKLIEITLLSPGKYFRLQKK